MLWITIDTNARFFENCNKNIEDVLVQIESGNIVVLFGFFLLRFHTCHTSLIHILESTQKTLAYC